MIWTVSCMTMPASRQSGGDGRRNDKRDVFWKKYAETFRNIWESIVSQMPRVVSIKDVTLCNFLPSSVEENQFFDFYPENFTIWTSNRIILSFCAAVHPGFWTNLISENQMRQSGRVTIILVHAQIQHLWHLCFITSTLISYDPVTSCGVNW